MEASTLQIPRTGADLAPKGGDGASSESSQRQMTDAHKAALAAGRNQSYAVKAYLGWLRDNKPKRGRKRASDTIVSQLARIATELHEADPLQELLLLQAQFDLEQELRIMNQPSDKDMLEANFIAAAGGYSATKGIEYATWRRVGVSAEVLAKAGIKRT